MRFNDKHGAHVSLSSCKTVATRVKSFANAVVFSHRPLSTLETFMFEIVEQEQGWSGHVRCGVTEHNPRDMKIPPYLLPDLAQMGRTWVFAIKPNNEKPLGDEHLRDDGGHNYQRLEAGDEDNNLLYCGETALNSFLRPTDRGSRIAIRRGTTGDLYFYINGKKFGPCASGVPPNVYAAVDVYGSTKGVKIIPCGGKFYVLEIYCC